MAYLGQVESRPDFAAVPDPASQWKSTGRIMEIEGNFVFFYVMVTSKNSKKQCPISEIRIFCPPTGAPKLSYDPDDKHAIPLYPHFKPADLPERPQNKKYVLVHVFLHKRYSTNQFSAVYTSEKLFC